MLGVARADDTTKDLSTHDLRNKFAQKAPVNARVVTPVPKHTYRERSPKRWLELGPNLARCAPESKSGDVDRVAERVFAEPWTTPARLTAVVRSEVHDALRLASVVFDGQLVDQRFELRNLRHDINIGAHRFLVSSVRPAVDPKGNLRTANLAL